MSAWIAARLGDLCKIEIGKTPSRGTARYWDKARETDNVWLSIADLTKLQGNVIIDSNEYVSDEAAKHLKPVKAGTLMMSFKLSIGKMAVAGRDLFTNEAIAALTINTNTLSREYLQYFLSGYDWDAETAGDHKLMGKTLNKAKLKELVIKFPPLSEQQRIVGILDQAFEAIAKVKANAERNLFKTKTMLAEELRTMLTAGREGWIRTTIGEQLTLQRGYDITKSEQRPGEIPVVSSSGIKSYHSDSKVRGPGVVIGRKGTLGSAFYIEGDFWPHDTSLYVKDFKGNNPKFVYYAFCGLNVKHLDSGTANPALNRNTVHALQVNWPPFGLQSEFCAYLDELCDGSGRLEALYSSKIQQFNDLKASVLHQAFSGKL